jgi:hypothetical protein
LPTEARAEAVALDGACDAALQLSHWPGNRTPAGWKRDLGVEMAFAFVASDERARFDAATNDHHDADGVLSLFVALEPERAAPHRARFERAAAFSDFQQGEDEEALKLAAVLDGLAHSPASPLAGKLADLAEPEALAALTEHALAMLPGLPGELERHRELWEDELGWFQVTRDAVRAGEVALTELPGARLTVVEWDAEAHPAAVDASCRGDLVLHAIEGAEGYHYRADWRGWAWADTVSEARPRIRALDLEKLSLPLNSLESNRRGRWMSRGYANRGRSEALRFTNPAGHELESHLQPTEVVQKLAWFLIERGGM